MDSSICDVAVDKSPGGNVEIWSEGVAGEGEGAGGMGGVLAGGLLAGGLLAGGLLAGGLLAGGLLEGGGAAVLAGSVNSAKLAGRCSVHCTYVTVLHHLSDFDCKNHAALDDDMHKVICALKDRLQSQDGTDFSCDICCSILCR